MYQPLPNGLSPITQGRWGNNEMNIEAGIGRWFWAVCIAVTLLNAAIFRARANRRIEEHPELEEGYGKIIKGFVIWTGLPWIVMGVSCTVGDVPTVLHYFRPRDGNPFVIAFFASAFFIYGLGTYWLFARNGAEMLTRHPGLFNFDFTSPRMVKLFWLLLVMGGIAAFLAMVLLDIPLPEQLQNR